jgi:hypothetical protein
MIAIAMAMKRRKRRKTKSPAPLESAGGVAVVRSKAVAAIRRSAITQ